MSWPKKIKLGDKYRDKISGFEGIAVTRVEYLYGCVRVGLEREGAADVKAEDREHLFDEQRLVEVKTEKPPKATATRGGPRPAPPERSVPRR